MRPPAPTLRGLNIWFMAWAALLLAIPAAGLAWNTAGHLSRGLPTSALADGGETLLTRRLDVFIASNIGLRKQMIDIGRDVKTFLAGGSPRVVEGEDGWLFITDNDVFGQATGVRIDLAGLEHFAEVAGALADEAKANGRRFVVAVAPNSHTIYRHKLPLWARTKPASTELDVLLQILARRGIPAVDLRPSLLARAETRPVYFRGDTHWTLLGASLAFNDIVANLGLDGEAIDIDRDFGPDVERDRPGDLVGIAGRQPPWIETMPAVKSRVLPAPDELARQVLGEGVNSESYSLRLKSPPPDIGQRPGVLVIGDSFSGTLFGPLFMRFAREFTWMHYRNGRIDLGAVAKADPDIVVFEVVERAVPFLKQRPQ